VSNIADNSPIQIARQSLLAPTGLEDMHLERALNALMRGGVDNADLYFQVTRNESWSLEDGIVKGGSYSLDQGVGVRAMAGEKTGFAYSDELALPALMQASEAASAIARSGDDGRVRVAVPRSGHQLYTAVDPIAGLPDSDAKTPANTTTMGPVGPETLAPVPPNSDAKKPTMIAPQMPAIGPAPEASPKASASGSAMMPVVMPPNASPRRLDRSKNFML